MSLTLKVEFSDDQLAELRRGIIEEIKQSPLDFGKRTKPYTVKEFAEITPWSERTIRDKIAAKLIEKLDVTGNYLIPASEYERLMGL